jgi:hypothetical protein
MSGDLTEAPRPLGKRGLALLAALAMTVAMLFALSAPPSASAATGGFCQSSWLQPYGQCHMPHSLANNHHTLAVQTTQRAGCVALLGYYGEQLDSWVCTGANSVGYYYTPAWRPAGLYRGAIRNNNGTYASAYGGLWGCCR